MVINLKSHTMSMSTLTSIETSKIDPSNKVTFASAARPDVDGFFFGEVFGASSEIGGALFADSAGMIKHSKNMKIKSNKNKNSFSICYLKRNSIYFRKFHYIYYIITNEVIKWLLLL